MALTEVLLNAVQHGLQGLSGRIFINASRAGDRLNVEVVDDGRGLPSQFANTESDRLGLQIVRTLIVGELQGTFELELAPGGGTRAVIDVPLVHE